MCSSGTTGPPKLTQLTNYGVVAFLQLSKIPLKRSLDSVVYSITPTFHSGSISFVFTHLIQGCTHAMPSEYNRDQLLMVIKKYNVTHLNVYASVLLDLVKSADVQRRDFSGVLEIATGAATTSEEVKLLVKATLGVQRLIDSYGLTEALPVTLFDATLSKLGSVGFLMPNVNLKVVDIETRNNLHANEKGEVIVKGPQLAKGYYKNPEATKKMFDKHGWLKTGDIGYFDEDGNIYITDRLKDVIKTGGIQVSPSEIEKVLIQHPKIADVGVVGVPDHDGCDGEVPKAFVVKKDPTLTADDVNQFVQDGSATIKGSTDLFLSPDTPKSNIKIDYDSCLHFVPYHIRATARPYNPTGPETFNVTVVKINYYHFIIQLERTDRNSGWRGALKIDWELFSLSDYITTTATLQYSVDYDWNLQFTSSNSKVSSVYNQGTSSIHANQSNPNLQPRLSTSKQNGHRYLVFDQVPPTKLIANIDLNPSPGQRDLVTVFVAYRIDDLPPNALDVFVNGLFGNDRPGWNKFVAFRVQPTYPMTVGGAEPDKIEISSFPVNANPKTVGIWNILSVQWNVDGGVDGSSVWCNGKLLQRFQAKTYPSDTVLTIGNIDSFGTKPTLVSIGELILIRDIVITDEVMKEYHQHLVYKWGVTADPISG